MRNPPIRSTIAVTTASLLALALSACGGGDDPPETGAPPTTDVPVTFAEGPEGEDAPVPTDCAEVRTDALADAWGAEPILDTADSYYEEPIEELRCEFWSDAQATDQLTLQISVASHFSAYNASQMGTSSEDFVEVDGFDEARRYDNGLLIATRNGLVAIVDADESLTEEQVVAVALDATSPG